MYTSSSSFVYLCFFLLTAMHVESLAFCVWEWRRYTIQYDYLYVNSFSVVGLTVTTYFIEQTSTIHSVDTELVYAVLMLSFSKQYKISCFNPLCQGFSNFFVLWPRFDKRFFYAARLMDSLDVNNTFESLITNLKMHFCQWRNPTNAHNPRNWRK